MVTPPNWQKAEETLFDHAQTVIHYMEKEYPDTLISFFGFYAEPIQGLFEFHIDTPENATQVAMKQEQRYIERRQKRLTRSLSWKIAKYHLVTPRILDYSFTVDFFRFQTVDTIVFEDWLAFFDSDEYPQGREDVDDDYLQGNSRLLLWKVTERLIESNAFARLRLASPFRIGYQFHDNELVTLRILNWPR